MIQITVKRRDLVIVTAIVAIVTSLVWIVGSARASANAAGATPVVYVATGENFPDALGAASAAAVQAGPVLLVTKTSIPGTTTNELKRLKPTTIYVAGGKAVISDAVLNTLKNYAPTVTRLAGANRYETAVEVSKSAFPATGIGGNTAALEARIHALETLLAGVTRHDNTLTLSGMNLQIVNGNGTTAISNGLGNVIIGYNEANYGQLRTGSHYLIVGSEHAYTASAGIVAGYHNTSSADNASILGGGYNTAGSADAIVVSGYGNAATGVDAIVLAGSYNSASGKFASVTGGSFNTASADYASVTGGSSNTASADHASVTGGSSNTADGVQSAVTGGEWNTAGGANASVTGGNYNSASATYASASGGYGNVANGYAATVSGGYTNTAGGPESSVLGGISETTSSYYSTYPYCGCTP